MVFYPLENSKSDVKESSCDNKSLFNNEEVAEYYFSCHERMVNDDASRLKLNYSVSKVLSESFIQENDKGN